ncbi:MULTISPECIES: acyl-CoA dehydrogenase family protein [unclassified Streptomyces]|uniref:acyl-CoA dehydrogenase family protein n=1 Tax=unclassified Streptomyces TaxID=2593676 RepID=UPI0011E89ED5|nr:acyl-CoA dehydrogenase family protein [Streptomyces sp. sk2.1]TXS54773.1 acyl-CoA dehydrogenase [Streptomyces sp. sk2.1]
MDAAFSAEQDEIRRTLRTLLTRHGTPDDVGDAALTADGYDTALWRRLARDLGLPGLALPEKYGGVGCGLAELAVACEETGRALLPSPLIATAALAAPLIAALGTAAQRAELLPRIAAGELTAALAVPGAALTAALGLTADPTGGTWAGGGRAGGVQAASAATGTTTRRLYGEVDQVLDGHSADLLLVAAHTGGFPRSRTLLFLVRPEAATGLVRTRHTTLDGTRPSARVELRDTGAELLGADDTRDVIGALAGVGGPAAALLAAEAVGSAASALERTVEHVKAREQFGRPIGSFQAVKHRLADLYVQVRAARSAAYYAAWDPTAGGLALAQALEALRLTAAEAVQLHGGIGFTWEHEAHLYFKRAAAAELFLGPGHALRDHAARQAGLFAPPDAGPPGADAPAAGASDAGPGAAERVVVR